MCAVAPKYLEGHGALSISRGDNTEYGVLRTGKRRSISTQGLDSKGIVFLFFSFRTPPSLALGIEL